MKTNLNYLIKLLKNMEYYNNMSPFPIYDTEYINEIKTRIKKMEKEEIDYDSLPVTACKYCNELSIIVDEVENDVCLRCNSINEIVVYKNIFEYLTSKINDDN